MPKRYAFWRESNGKPYRGRDERFALSHLLKSFGEQAKVNGEEITWPASAVTMLQTCLRPAVVVVAPDGSELNPTDTWHLLWQALVSHVKAQGGGNAVDSRKLLEQADQRAAEFFRKPLERFTFVTSLNLQEVPATKIKLTNSVFRPVRRRSDFPYPEVLERAYPEILKRAQKFGGAHVRLELEARTMDDAVDRALADLNLLRGLWTLFGNYGSFTIHWGSVKANRLGVIHTGPIQTLHNPDGSSFRNLFWHDRDVGDEAKLFTPARGWPEVEKRRRWALRRVRKHAFATELEQLIGRYAIALDQVHLDVAFIHLWSILEKLTDTVGANYDETIRRAVWPYSDRLIAREMLGSMRLHRNRLIHAAGSDGELQSQVAGMVKSFVEPHLVRLIRNDLAVGSIEQYGKQLATPVELSELQRQHIRLGRAIRFMKRMEH